MNTEQIVQQVVDLVTRWGLKVVGAIAVLILGRMVAGLLRSGTRRALTARGVDTTLVPFVSALVYYFVLAVVVIAVLSLFGIETTSMVAMLGAAGLAIGLALQGTLSHFAAGVMLLVFRPFRVGDFVEVGGTKGTVEEVGIFTTTLRTGDNVKILVPNSEIYGNSIHNYHGYDTRRIDLVVGIGYDDDIDQAMEIIRGVVEADERVLDDPAVVIAVADLGDSSVNLHVRPWCATGDYWALRWELTQRIKVALEAGGCSIPFPQRDVHLFQESQAATGITA